MIGAIPHDMIGTLYEFDRCGRTKKYPLFGRGSEFTDDAVTTIAAAVRADGPGRRKSIDRQRICLV